MKMTSKLIAAAMLAGTFSVAQAAPMDVFDLKTDSGADVFTDTLGEGAFYGRSFVLNADCLVPRPETELLVETALSKLPHGGTLLDLGTGSGAIALSILAERPDCKGIATDISEKALSCAKENAQRLGLSDRVTFTPSDWFTGLADQQFDLIVSNPPYISRTELEDMNEEALLFDPEIALFAEDDGLAAYDAICAEVNQFLRPEGWLMVEIGFRQAKSVSELFTQAKLKNISVLQDLAGHDRVVIGQRQMAEC